MKKNRCVRVAFTMLMSCLLWTGLDKEGVKATSDYVIEDGVLLEYTGDSSYVSLPSEVKEIGASAFEGNDKLKKVTLTSNVKEIGPQAFAYNPFVYFGPYHLFYRKTQQSAHLQKTSKS